MLNIQSVIKIIISLAVILFCTQIGKKYPTLAGLIATMPLTGFLVLFWLWSDNPGNFTLLKDYTRGALWGIVPSILFFLVAYFCFQKRVPFPLILTASFTTWLIAAAIHQLILKN